jgi:hypothetical protein
MAAMQMASADWAAEQLAQAKWEDEQMGEARIPKEAADVVRRLLNAWVEVTVPSKHQDLILHTFQELARGHSLVVPDLPTERWETVTPGRVHTRDTVRVKRDAYSDDVGRMHNGRRGRVIGVRYGDIIIKYEDGRQPPFEAVHHAPAKLERLRK